MRTHQSSELSPLVMALVIVRWSITSAAIRIPPYLAGAATSKTCSSIL